MRTRVKICGITRVDDAQFAVEQGVDAIGLVFYARSPRCIGVEQAIAICRRLPAFVSSVALFKDADTHTVAQLIKATGIDLLQFHGSESADFCEQFERPYIKALGMAGENRDDVVAMAQPYTQARGFLLDSHAPGAAGGTGHTFDWNTVPDNLPGPLILAGGLKVDNVAQAINRVKPYAVDVSSGVEKQPGIKDVDKIRAFMRQVRQMNIAE